MSKRVKILINGITLENANLIPLLLKVKNWQNFKTEIVFVGNKNFKEKINELKIIGKNYKFIEITPDKEILTKFQLIFEGFKRNIKLIKKFDKNFLIKNNFDVVYTISSVLDLIIFPFFVRMKNPKIKWATVFDNIVPLNDPGNKVVRFLAWLFFQISLFLLKKADCIFVISKDLREYLINKGFNSKRIVLTGNGVEADLIKKAKRDPKYNIDALFVGRINETKGIYDMLNVLEIVKNKYPNFKLAIMGRGDINNEKKYKEEIKKRGLAQNIQFLGFKSGLEKFNIIKSSKIFLFLSKSESFGIALLEAVCCGLKCFVYDLPTYKNIYKNGEINIFKKGDYISVGNSVIKTFEKKEFDNSRGKLLINKYSWEKIAKIELESFRELIE